jgi:hypothetical protein
MGCGPSMIWAPEVVSDDCSGRMLYNGGIQVPIVQVRLEQSAAAQFAKQGIQLKIKQKHFIDKSSRPETHCLLVFAIVTSLPTKVRVFRASR